MLYVFISLILIGMSLIAILNVFTFPRLKPSPKSSAYTPFLSILIPARNEAHTIEGTLRSLLQQDYPNFEIILLDDHSTDGTGEIARAIRDPHLRVVSGGLLPVGWLGKNWACYQLAQFASGEYLIFTDADVRWSPNALTSVVESLQLTDADLLTVWPTQQTITWSERLVVPLMALAVIGYLPVIGTHYTPLSAFAAACGQCMIWKRQAYFKIGGHQAVANNVLEDVTMARLVKAHGMSLRMLDGAGLITCRMYTNWQAVRNGYAKNILAGFGNSIVILLAATVFHWFIFILPWLFPWTISLAVLGVGLRMLTAAFTRQRVLDGLLMPISVLLMTVIALQSIYWHYSGKTQWKARNITLTEPESPTWTPHTSS